MDIRNKLRQSFTDHFGKCDVEIFSPGRANIIGEHTDYNDGFVLPFAIRQGIYLFAAKSENSIITIIASDTDEKTTIDLTDIKSPKYGWEKFVFQVIAAVGQDRLSGFNLVYGGDLPIGGGISSSSALTCGLVSLINDLCSLGMNADDIVQKSVEAERGYGVRGGIMDQFTIIKALENHAILLDCKDNSFTQVPLNLGSHSFYLFNTNVKHNLLHTDYNNRRAECEHAVDIISEKYRYITSLRDLEISEIDKLKSILDEKVYRRVGFVITENQRVAGAKLALETNDLAALGKLLTASHVGLSQDYEVSCPELDWLVDIASDNHNILGARMMGGGFGGCTINLVKDKLDQNWIDKISERYSIKFGIDMAILPIQSGNGIQSNIYNL